MDWTEAGIILGLILINAFFAGSELALVSARKPRLQARADEGHKGARAALSLLEDPTRLLSTVQLGITLVGILTGVYSGAAFADDLALLLRRIGWIAPYAQEVSFGIIVVLVGYLSLIVGELVPKRIALAHAERIAELVSRPMAFIARIAFPLVWLLGVSTEAFARLVPLRKVPQSSLIEDELRALIIAGAKEGVFHRREKEMIEAVLRLADRSAESVMIPRGDIVWLDVNSSLEEMWNEARASGHSRFPLCDGELEQIIGVITLGELGEAWRTGHLDRTQVSRQPLYVPESVSLLRLAELLRESETHMAFVADEYGEIQGLVTAADILKAIAGELVEIGGPERAEAVRRPDGSWLMDGSISIHEAQRLLERDDLAHGEDYHTLAGFVLWHLDRLPTPGDCLDWRDLHIEVVDMDGPRIDKLLLSRVALPEPPRQAAA